MLDVEETAEAVPGAAGDPLTEPISAADPA
jgi:hypothetical protein